MARRDCINPCIARMCSLLTDTSLIAFFCMIQIISRTVVRASVACVLKTAAKAWSEQVINSTMRLQGCSEEHRLLEATQPVKALR